MLMAGTTTRYVFDLHPGDVYWCTADCGWYGCCCLLPDMVLALACHCALYDMKPSSNHFLVHHEEAAWMLGG